MIVDRAIYVDGTRVAAPGSLRETHEACRAVSGIAWIGVLHPTAAEFAAVAGEFGLHALAAEDAITAHQRPKLDRYEATLFVVLKAARYLDEPETVEFAELHVFVGSDFVVTVRHGNAPDLGRVRRRMEAQPALLRLGTEAILYAILDQVVDEYGPVVVGLENDIDELETEVFGGNAGVSRRAYELTREVIELQRAVTPLTEVIGTLMAGWETDGIDPELQRSLRDVQDHTLRVQEQADAFRALLQNILSVNLTIVGLQQNDEIKQQNDEIKKISAWAAILFAPTLIGTIYGMNFEHMPEVPWRLGYPFALLLMAMVSVGLFLIFRRRGWLT
jgi:magnesium transporter